MNIEKDRAVTLSYHLTDDDGKVIDSSRESGGMPYIHGHGNLVPGVERALDGKAAGANFDVVVSPEDGYGVHDPQLDVAIPKDAFPEDVVGQLAPGVMFQGPHPRDQRKMAMFTVAEVLDAEVRCSANHPLAGQTLHFNLEVLDVREATVEEVAHGHVHGPGGHEH
jgi:FKBP-type peptidyl-prolyl cis-trans isomerase SlyD